METAPDGGPAIDPNAISNWGHPAACNISIAGLRIYTLAMACLSLELINLWESNPNISAVVQLDAMTKHLSAATSETDSAKPSTQEQRAQCRAAIPKSTARSALPNCPGSPPTPTVLPIPSWPTSLPPQQATLPPTRRAHVWNRPRATAVVAGLPARLVPPAAGRRRRAGRRRQGHWHRQAGGVLSAGSPVVSPDLGPSNLRSY